MHTVIYIIRITRNPKRKKKIKNEHLKENAMDTISRLSDKTSSKFMSFLGLRHDKSIAARKF